MGASADFYEGAHRHVGAQQRADRRLTAFDRAWDQIRPALDGLYLSFESAFSPHLLDDAFPAATLRRLREIKQRVDPGNVFHQNFPVQQPAPPTGQ